MKVFYELIEDTKDCLRFSYCPENGKERGVIEYYKKDEQMWLEKYADGDYLRYTFPAEINKRVKELNKEFIGAGIFRQIEKFKYPISQVIYGDPVMDDILSRLNKGEVPKNGVVEVWEKV